MQIRPAGPSGAAALRANSLASGAPVRHHRKMPVARGVAVVVDGPRVLVMKRFRRRASAAECDVCAVQGRPGPACPGHHYAVLPGGHVEPGESHEQTAVRELREETSLEGRVAGLLWTGFHGDRPASYFLFADLVGTPVLSGEDADENAPDNHRELAWASAEEFARLNLRPDELRPQLAAFLATRGSGRQPGTAEAGLSAPR
jgi:8-oxo-dGTP pyrophosphatase MutT (NUDIX family)